MRYPLSALVEACGMSEAALAREIGLSGSTLVQARKVGFVESAADRYACRAGLVPWLVWSDWLDDALVECAEPSCTERFVPLRKPHRFCSPRCYQRTYQRERARRLYQEDEAHREAEKAKARAYRAANPRIITVKNRAYRERTVEQRKAYMARYRAENRELINERQREYDRRVRAEQQAS